MDPGRAVHSTGLAKWLPAAVRLEDTLCLFPASVGLTVSRDLLCFPGLLQILSFIILNLCYWGGRWSFPWGRATAGGRCHRGWHPRALRGWRRCLSETSRLSLEPVETDKPFQRPARTGRGAACSSPESYLSGLPRLPSAMSFSLQWQRRERQLIRSDLPMSWMSQRGKQIPPWSSSAARGCLHPSVPTNPTRSLGGMDGWPLPEETRQPLMLLFLNQGKDGADATRPTGIVIHVFSTNQQLW